MRLLPVRGLLVAAAVAGALVLTLGATLLRSLSRSALERALHALPKNKALGALSRRTIELEGRRVELTYHHARTSRPRPGALPVVLVHGTPSTLFTWTELVHGGPDLAGLAATRDVYAIEVAGHGVAAGDGVVDFEACARHVAAAMRGLGLERAHLVGQSYGGEFAWRAALNASELVAGLVLIDSSGLARRAGDWLPEEVAMRDNPLADWGWALNSRARIERALAPHFRDLPPDRVEEFFLVCRNARNWRAMVALVRDETGGRQGELADLAAPTLVLWGAEDLAYPVEVYGRRFAREIPDARLVVLPGTGHYPHEERPAETMAALEEFFDAVEAADPDTR